MNRKVKSVIRSGAYSGRIKLKLKKRGMTYKTVEQHNAGTAAFFKYMLQSVKGDILPNDRPSKVKLIYSDYTSRYGTPYYDFSDVTTEGDVAKVTYYFVIPETVVEQGTVVGLQLESVSSVVYATVAFDNPITITENTNIELSWELSITNK